VIVSFADRATEDLFHGTRSRETRRLPTDIPRVARRKLDMLDAAAELRDLRSPPGNRLEALRGDLAGLHSIRINDQWRIVFRWTSSGPAEVGIVDYH
jgi:proteic killer suppression protein